MATFLLKKSGQQFSDAKFFGIYRDGGFVILPGKRSKEQVEEWLQGFQRNADRVLICDRLQFTATLCHINKPGGSSSGGKVITCTDCVFSYLDMALSWS